MKKTLTTCLLSLISFSSFAFHPAPNPETSISLNSFCASFNEIFNRNMKFTDPNSKDMEVDLAVISGKIHTIRVGHKNTIIGEKDTRTSSYTPDIPGFKIYRSRLNVQAMISMVNEPDVYYGVQLLDESPCSLNELGRFNLLQTAYENGLTVTLKVAKIRPFSAPIGLDDDGYIMQDFNLKYGYILDVEVTDPAPPPPIPVADVNAVANNQTRLALASASVGLILGVGLMGFIVRRRF